MMNFDKWIEEMAREVFLPTEESKKAMSSIFDMYDDDYDEEESPGSGSKKRWGPAV